MPGISDDEQFVLHLVSFVLSLFSFPHSPKSNNISTSVLVLLPLPSLLLHCLGSSTGVCVCSVYVYAKFTRLKIPYNNAPLVQQSHPIPPDWTCKTKVRSIVIEIGCVASAQHRRRLANGHLYPFDLSDKFGNSKPDYTLFALLFFHATKYSIHEICELQISAWTISGIEWMLFHSIRGAHRCV